MGNGQIYQFCYYGESVAISPLIVGVVVDD